MRERIKQHKKEGGTTTKAPGLRPQAPLSNVRGGCGGGGPCCNLFTAELLLHWRVFFSASLLLNPVYELQF